MRWNKDLMFDPHSWSMSWDTRTGKPVMPAYTHLRVPQVGSQIWLTNNFRNDTTRESWAYDLNIGVYASGDEFVFHNRDTRERFWFELETLDGRSVPKAWLSQDGQQMMLCDFDHMIAVRLADYSTPRRVRSIAAIYPHHAAMPVGSAPFDLSIPDRKKGNKIRAYAKRMKETCDLMLKLQDNPEVPRIWNVGDKVDKIAEQLKDMPDPHEFLMGKPLEHLFLTKRAVEARWAALGRFEEQHEKLRIRRV